MRTGKAPLRAPRTLPTDAENILGLPGGLAASLRIAVGMYGHASAVGYEWKRSSTMGCLHTQIQSRGW